MGWLGCMFGLLDLRIVLWVCGWFGWFVACYACSYAGCCYGLSLSWFELLLVVI